MRARLICALCASSCEYLRNMNKKDRERYQLEMFKAKFSGFPTGTIVPSEEPDFLIEDGERIIGVELTEFYRGTPTNQMPRQASESLKNQIVERARAMFEGNGGPFLIVYVYFGFHLELRKNRVTELASKLAKIVSDNPVNIGETIVLENQWDDLNYFPEEFISIDILRPFEITQPLWAVPDADVIPKFSIDTIQQVIDKKNVLTPAYRKRTQELWLLIIHGFTLSYTFEDEREVLGHNYNSDFDRVFLFDMFSQTPIELQIKSEDYS